MGSKSSDESGSSDSGSSEDLTAGEISNQEADRNISDEPSDKENSTSEDESAASSQEGHSNQAPLNGGGELSPQQINPSRKTTTTESGNDSPIAHEDAMHTDSDAEEADVLSQHASNSETGSKNERDMPKSRSVSRRSSYGESEGQTDDLSSEIETDDSAEVATSMTYRQWRMLHGEPTRVKRLRKKVGYRDAYRQLLNDEIDKAMKCDIQDESTAAEKQTTSQIGMTIWKGEEKSAFFDAIALRGRDDLPFIAKRTGKSLLEVRQYLLLLEQGVTQSMTKTVDDTGYSYDQIPAAVELSEQLCERLEEAADTIARYQQKQETNLEANKHGDEWLIDWEFSKILEEKFDSIEAEAPPHDNDKGGGENARSSNSESLASCNLLHPRNFVRLSSRIFMNHEDTTRDWETYDKYGPAIYMTAMQDIQQLVISLTTRIVYTAALQCLSRCRATADAEETTPKAVRKSDLLAALHILGLKSDSKSYWAELPSRLGLTCFWNKRVHKDETTTGHMVPTRDAEEWLLQKTRGLHVEGMQRIVVRSHHKAHLADADASPDCGTNKPVRDLQKQGEETRGSAGTPPGEIIGGNSRQSDIESTDRTSQSSESGESSDHASSGDEDEDDEMSVDDASPEKSEQDLGHQQVVVHDPEDAAKIRDKIASRAEEHRLWHLLGLQPPTGTKPVLPIDVKVNDRSRRQETALQHQEDWRLNTVYRPQWVNSSSTDLKRRLEAGEEDVRKRYKPDPISTVTSAGVDNYDSSSVVVSNDSMDESSSDEPPDPIAEDSDLDARNAVRLRRPSLPRRSSQAALETLEASLDARSLLNNDLSSGDDYAPG